MTEIHAKIVLGVVCFVCGCSVTSKIYEAQNAYKREQSAIQYANVVKDYEQKLSEAIESRDLANSRVDALISSNGDLSDRLRIAISTSNSTKTDSANPDKIALTKCRILLSESAKLLEEGCATVGRCAADTEALKVLHEVK